ncbi:hyaluronan-binding protein 2 [Pungitius pungitius]|uniref:hyaluronan-binding protein 2 n=1 Tax=Pungitius pungitius TaxID=134920 RepID=UPI002E153209
MNLKLLSFCLFFVVLLVPVELKHKKDKHHHDLKGQGPQNRPGKKRGRYEDILRDFVIAEGASDGDGDDDDDDHGNSDWVFEMQEPDGQCNPNPCFNNGVCEEKRKRNFKCDCPKPFKGKKCQKGPKHCRKGRCGRGECVLTSTPPFYECKCKEPFQPPHCMRMSLCQPNPCKNGGQCIRDGNDFDCLCPMGHRGRFCHVGPSDCYVDNGESYRGNVSETDDGHECLYWNSHFILEAGADPFNSFEDSDGLGPHNLCRNPDGDQMPWCFFRQGHRLSWDYCDITKCLQPGVVTTETTLPGGISPDATLSPPPSPELLTVTPPTNVLPSQASQPSPTPAEVTPSAAAPLQQFATCGQPQPKKNVARIFGGLKVPPGAAPWQVSLQVRPKSTNKPFSHTCGGTLIASCWVLTAGHCIAQTKDMQVVIGALSTNIEEPTAQTIQVEEAIVHENYRETTAAVYNDIGLLRLKGTDGVCANETQFVKTACLPNAQLPDGMECKISGWGATEDSPNGSPHLLDANVMLINQEKCSERRVYGTVLDNSMLCAGHLLGGVDSCQGDSGGPLICDQNNAKVLYGVVSWGDQCGKKNKPGVYARVTQFLDWIKLKTQAASP